MNERLKSIIAERGIVTRDKAQIISHHGGLQKWIVDLRAVFLSAEAMDLITDAFWDKYAQKLPFQLAGMEVAAVPLVTGLLLKARQRGLDVNGFVIRKERKTTGLGKAIEGIVTSDQVIVVDDVINSGESLEKACIAVESEGMQVKEIFCVVDYQAPSGKRWRQQRGVGVASLFALSDFGLDLDLRERTKPAVLYSKLWRFGPRTGYPYYVVPKSAPLIAGGRIFMGGDTGVMWAVDAVTGKAIWSFRAPGSHRKGIWSSPACHDGRVYFGAYNGNLYCLSAETGAIIWENQVCDWIGSSPLVVPNHGLLYIGLEYEKPKSKGSHAAFSLETGQMKWERPLAEFEHGSAVWWEKGDLVIFGSNDHFIVAREPLTGRVVWKFPTIRSIKYAPAVENERGLVAAASFDGNIYILKAETGEKVAAIQTDNICYTTPLFAAGRLFCGSADKHLYVVDLETMSVIEKLSAGSRVFSSPQLIDGHVVFGTTGGWIFEIDPATLEVKGKLALPDAVTNAVIADRDGATIYASTYMNDLFAIKRRRV